VVRRRARHFRGTGAPISPLVGLGYLGATVFFAFFAIYNGLVELKQRVKQAIALIDVELKRRNDLIPALVGR